MSGNPLLGLTDYHQKRLKFIETERSSIAPFSRPIPWPRKPADDSLPPSLVCLVALVCFVYLVYLVHLVSFVQRLNQTNQTDQTNQMNQSDQNVW